jgi:hypothetical protein
VAALSSASHPRPTAATSAATAAERDQPATRRANPAGKLCAKPTALTVAGPRRWLNRRWARPHTAKEATSKISLSGLECNRQCAAGVAGDQLWSCDFGVYKKRKIVRFLF